MVEGLDCLMACLKFSFIDEEAPIYPSFNFQLPLDPSISCRLPLLYHPGRYLAADAIAVSNASLGSRSLASNSIILTVIIKLSPVPDKAGISPASASPSSLQQRVNNEARVSSHSPSGLYRAARRSRMEHGVRKLRGSSGNMIGDSCTV